MSKNANTEQIFQWTMAGTKHYILVGVIGSLAEPAGQLRSRRRTMTHLGMQDILIECLSMYYPLVI